MKVHWSVALFLVIPIAWAAVVFLVLRSIDTTEWSPLQRMLLFVPVYALSLLAGIAAERAHRFVVHRRQQEVARRRQREVARRLLERYTPCDYHGGGKAEVGVFGDGSKGWRPATYSIDARNYCDECMERLCAAETWRRGQFHELDSAAVVRAALEKLRS